MKSILLTIACIVSALCAGAQTVHLNVQNRLSCPVRYQLIGGDCDNPQDLKFSDMQVTADVAHSYFSVPTVGWGGPPPPGIIGLRIYADYDWCSPVYTDVFIPSSGPTPLFGPTVIPTCSGCAPINTFFEIYCGSPNNIVMFF